MSFLNCTFLKFFHLMLWAGQPWCGLLLLHQYINPSRCFSLFFILSLTFLLKKTIHKKIISIRHMYKLNIIKGLVRLLMEYIYVNEKRWSIFPLLLGVMYWKQTFDSWEPWDILLKTRFSQIHWNYIRLQEARRKYW